MTAAEIQALRELEAKATPGPWSIDRGDILGPGGNRYPGIAHCQAWADLSHGGAAAIRFHEANPALIVAARNALPALLDEVELCLRAPQPPSGIRPPIYAEAERLRAENERLREAMRVALENVRQIDRIIARAVCDVTVGSIYGYVAGARAALDEKP